LFVFTNINDIHSFKLIEYMDKYKFKVVKNKKDKYANKLTTSMLIA